MILVSMLCVCGQAINKHQQTNDIGLVMANRCL